MHAYKIDFASQPWDEPLAGIRCKAHRLDGRQLRLVVYDRTMPPHWCERGHLGLLLEGRLAIEFPSGTVIFDAGDGIYIPSGPAHRHMAAVLTDAVKVVFVEDV